MVASGEWRMADGTAKCAECRIGKGVNVVI